MSPSQLGDQVRDLRTEANARDVAEIESTTSAEIESASTESLADTQTHQENNAELDSEWETGMQSSAESFK